MSTLLFVLPIGLGVAALMAHGLRRRELSRLASAALGVGLGAIVFLCVWRTNVAYYGGEFAPVTGGLAFLLLGLPLVGWIVRRG